MNLIYFNQRLMPIIKRNVVLPFKQLLPRRIARGWILAVKVGLLTFGVIFVVVPLVFHFIPAIPTNLVFLPFVRRWPESDFTLPHLLGLPGSINMYLQPTPDISVGLWHILPHSLVDEGSDDDPAFFKKSLENGLPVILYLHGNSGSRAGPHRIELYKLLRTLDYHVICFDYRGYADSTSVVPSEEGVVADGKFVYKWLKERIKDSPLIVWGHSLGTGVSGHLISELCQEGDPPTALILESPFNNLRDEVSHHYLTKLYRSMPFFEWFFLEPLKTSGLLFETDRHMAQITVPLLILHAEDDMVVPFELGKKLYTQALQVRPAHSKPVQFVAFAAQFGYGHKYIVKAPELPRIVRIFVQQSIDDFWTVE